MKEGITEGGLFPKEWDMARDLFVVVGRGGEELLGRLAAKGQQRMLVYLPEDADTTTLPKNAIVAHSPMDVLDGILSVSGLLPKRIVIKRQSDPWVSDETNLEVRRTVEESLRAKRMQMGTLNVQGPTWLMHGIANLAEAATRPSVACLRGAFHNRPCVIVSPGPSLAKNVHLLAGLKGRALLMTCSHALMVMQRAGVAPDLAMVADPSPLTMRHYEGVELDGLEALFVGVTCHPDHFSQPVRIRRMSPVSTSVF